MQPPPPSAPKKEAKTLSQCGYHALLNGDLDLSIQYLSRAITLGAKESSLFLNRACAYTQRGKLREAIADYTFVLRHSPTESTYNLRGQAYHQIGDDLHAISDFTCAIQRNPNAVAGYQCRGNTYLRRGKWNQALADFNRVLQLDPQNQRTYIARGKLYQDRGNMERALADLSRAIALDPTDGHAYNARAVVWFLQKNYAEAWINLRQARERGVNPNPRFVQDLERDSSALDRHWNDSDVTSLIALLAVPERFDGKRVVVHGHLDYYQGSCDLYTDEISCQHGLFENALYINASKYEQQARDLKQKYCMVDGIFSRMCPRPWGLGVGGIVKIKRLFLADYTRQ